MSIIILGKAIGVSIGASLVAAGAWYMADPTTIDNWMAPFFSAEVYGFLAEPDVGVAASTATTITGQKLKCQIESKDKFDCTVKEVTKLDDEKKHILLKDFLTRSDEDRGLIDATTAFTSKKLYQIKDIELNFKNRAWQNKPIKVSHTSGSTTTELGSIKSMFMLQGRATTFSGKTTSFIGQASKNLDSTTGYKCSWDSGATEGKECKIYPFVDKDSEKQDENINISQSKFVQTTSESTSIKQHHYYLIQFTNESDLTQTIEKFDKKTLVYVKDGSSNPAADNIVTFNKLSAVQVVEDQLLILKKHQEA